MDSSFDQIKKNLDPAFTYLVFGSRAGNGSRPDFSNVVDLLQRVQSPDIQWQVCHESDTDRDRLVVRVPPVRADGVIQKVLSAGLSKELSFFWYSSCADG